jgi:arsenate reductase
MSAMRKRVLFLCTGNSCRSQMAEAIVNHQPDSQWIAYSAGTRPACEVHPLAVKALAEVGIEHQGEPKSVRTMRDVPFDLVVTVCDAAAEECPAWLGQGSRVHLGFPDPALAEGSEEARLQVFRKVRADMLRLLPPLLAQHAS